MQKSLSIEFAVFLLFIAGLSVLSFSSLPTRTIFFIEFGVVFFVVALINTDFALSVLIFSMLLSPEINMGGIPGRSVAVRFDDILLFFVFFGWMAKMAINKELGMLKMTPLNLPILSYFLIAVFSSYLGYLGGLVKIQHSFFYLLKYFEYFLLFFMVVNNLRDLKQIKRFVYLILIVCFLVCCFAISQRMAGVMRVSAPFEGAEGEANTLAGYLILMMGIIFGLILNSEDRYQVLLMFGLLAFCLPAFLFTLSRGAWLAFPPMFLTLAVLTKKYRMHLFVLLLIGILVFPRISPAEVKSRVRETFGGGGTYQVMGRSVTLDESASARIDIWKVGMEKFMKRPVFGFGVPAGVVIDSQYARVLIETGFAGAVVYLILLLLIFRTGIYCYMETVGNGFAHGISVGFLAGYAGLLVHAIGAETFILVRIMEPFWFLAAVVVVLPELLHSQKVS